MLISNAFAQAAPAAAQDPMSSITGMLPLIFMFVVLYFLMIRPQMKRAKEHKTMLEALKKGDEVVTSGGLVGRITKVAEGYVTIEVARAPDSKGGDSAIEMTFQKAAVQTLLPNGTIKAI